jgi:hypothetical protein
MSPDESRIMAILENILESNLTPDEACRAFPELLPAVRERLRQLRGLKAEVDKVFPPRGPRRPPRANPPAEGGRDG